MLHLNFQRCFKKSQICRFRALQQSMAKHWGEASNLRLPALGESQLKTIEQWCLACALVSLGSEVRVRKLLRVGGRPLLLALISWGGIAGLSLVGVHLVN